MREEVIGVLKIKKVEKKRTKPMDSGKAVYAAT